MAKPKIPTGNRCHACGGAKHANPKDCPNAPKE